MNRTLVSAAALSFCLLAALPAGAQEALVVGAVRDQRGLPIVGASITGNRASGGALRATTDADGTFALHGAGVLAVTVACRYCRPATASVRADRPTIVIVRRYEALSDEAPTPADLENLPYAHVESSVALRPFTLLDQSSSPYPGSLLSDRGLSSAGSLLVDDGAPVYDIAAGQSPYALIPAQYERTAEVRDAGDAFLYGDQAAGGTVELEPFGDAALQSAGLGGDATLRAQAGSDRAGVTIGSFGNSQESRQRGDIFGSWQIAPSQTFEAAGGTEQGRVYQSSSPFAGNFSFADAAYTDANLANLSLSAVTDRGDYASGEGEYPASAIWSDSAVSAGVHSTGPLVAFADIAERSSSGLSVSAGPSGTPRVGGTISQTHADAGLTASGDEYVLTAGAGVFWIGYGGGAYGQSQPASTALAVPSLRALLFPNSRWSADLQQSGSFTLPTLVDQYAYGPAPLQFQRNALLAGTLSYTDQSRLRLSFEEASERVAGSASGTVNSSGFSATWQLSPEIALRAWSMHVTDNALQYGTVPAYEGVAPTVDALWMTYEAGSGVRIDALYRRDLLDDAPFFHVDGDVSGPVSGRLRWYAGAEDRLRRTFVDAGLRFSGR